MEMQRQKVDYASTQVPTDYRCADCGATGCRMYREYNTFLEHQRLRCTACALKDQKKNAPDNARAHTIEWLVAAVPTEDNESYWGYTSVPQAGVEWWDRLPVAP